LPKRETRRKIILEKKVSQAGVFLERKNMKPINVLIST
jgi:hypothetical protein